MTALPPVGRALTKDDVGLLRKGDAFRHVAAPEIIRVLRRTSGEWPDLWLHFEEDHDSAVLCDRFTFLERPEAIPTPSEGDTRSLDDVIASIKRLSSSEGDRKPDPFGLSQGTEAWPDRKPDDVAGVLEPVAWKVTDWKTSTVSLSYSKPDPMPGRLTIEPLVSGPEAAALIERLVGERRNIVSHATMGATDGVGLSCNDVSVEITRLRNKLHAGQTKAAAQRDAAVKALERIAHPEYGIGFRGLKSIAKRALASIKSDARMEGEGK